MSTLPGLLVALVTTAASPAPRGEILDFSAKWCGPCQQVAPLVARLERDGLPIRSVDVDANRALAQRFNVTAMPTFVLVVDGQEIDRHVGMMGESELREWLQRIPSESPAAIAEVRPAAASNASPFVADPAVKLGAPGAMQLLTASASSSSSGIESRPAPQRTQPPPSHAVESSPRSEQPAREQSEIEYRASNAPLNELPSQVQPEPSPMSASVRLRVTVNGRINLGSGTIIAANDQEALIVTCGHIFRGFADESHIEVNLFSGNSEQSTTGRLVRFDAEADVGLVRIEATSMLPTVAVATEAQRARDQERVLSIGCSGGQPPTAEELVVTAVNPYLGPDNLECSGVPVQGRSGGGLFRESGELIGICIAADPERKRGVYAGLLAVHELLDKSGYTSLYQSVSESVGVASTPATASPSRDTESVPLEPRQSSAGSLLDSLSPADDWPTASATAPRPSGPAGATRSVPSGVPVTLGPGADDAEIVCIIRPRNQPEAASQVVIIHQASPKMLSYLRGEMGTPSGGIDHALLSEGEGRRSRDHSVPTMGVSTDRSLPTAEHLRPGQFNTTHKPSLHPTTLTETPLPRRYVRSR